MTRVTAHAGAILTFAAVLEACGGGSGGGDSTPEPNTRLVVSPGQIAVAATPGELGPSVELTLTVQNPSAEGLFVGTGSTANGIETVDFHANSPTQATLTLGFKAPGMLLNGAYDDSIEIHVCFDAQCRSEIRNSPQTIQASYVVSGDGLATATLNSTTIEVTADRREGNARLGTLPLTLNTLPPSGVIARTTESSPVIQIAGVNGLDVAREVVVEFLPGYQLDLGTYEDEVTIRLCYHETCVREVRGSPFTIDTRLTVNVGIEQGLPPLQISDRVQLGHDVIAAEFNRERDELVTVGNHPENAIYVYDVATGVERKQALSRPPTSVSIAPDGQTAAVGHEFKVSIVDLTMAGTAGAPAPLLLDISTSVDKLILDGGGHVHAIPAVEWGGFLTSLDTATNTEQQVEFSFLRVMRRQPAADAFYAVPADVPSALIKWDISTGVASRLYSWPYSSEHDSCIGFWFNESGSEIYSACGERFQTSADPAEDMIHTGTMVITQPASWSEHGIRALSHFAANSEIALIESYWVDCNPDTSFRPCYTRLARYDDQSLARAALHAIGPITVGGTPYAQLGRFVFHDSSGKKYLIGELENPPSEAARFWLSVVE